MTYLEDMGYKQLDVYIFIHRYSEYQALHRYVRGVNEGRAPIQNFAFSALTLVRAQWDDIKPDLIKFVEDCAAFMDRFTRLESILRDMDTELPGVADHNYVDIALLPEVEQVLSVRYNQEISEAQWANLRQVIPAAFLRWRHIVDVELADEFPALARVFEVFETLDHPTTLFRCLKCSTPETSRAVAYADLISHGCCNEPFDFDSTSRRYPRSASGYYNAAVFHFRYHPWSYDRLVFHTWGSSLVKRSMTLWGVDPYKASGAESMDFLFDCLTCDTTEPILSMDWRTMVSIESTRLGRRLSLIVFCTIQIDHVSNHPRYHRLQTVPLPRSNSATHASSD